MSPAHGDEGGIPRGPRRALPPRPVNDDGGRDANESRNETLRRRHLQRRARSHGLQLRHSAYGYALIDATRNHVEGRNDLTLDEVESRLAP